jgi:Zn-dependent protease
VRWAGVVARCLGVPVEVHYSWPPVFAFVVWLLANEYFPRVVPHLSPVAYWSAGFATSAMVFVCLLAHEFGHVIVAQSRGLAVTRVRLVLLGALVEIEVEGSSCQEELALAVAGPSVSLLVGSAFIGGWLLIGGTPGFWRVFFLYLALCNILLAFVNLLPGLPLDGGRLLRASLWRLTGDRAQATLWADRLGLGIGVAVCVVGLVASLCWGMGLGLWIVLVGVFLVFTGR